MDVYDFVVVGGGMAGAASAESLSRRGKRVALIERYAPEHTNGGSHGDGRIIRYSYIDSLYMEMATLSYPLWDALSERAGEPLTQITGGCDFGLIGSEKLSAIVQNCEKFGFEYERLSPAELSQRFPQFYIPETYEAIYQASSGVAFADKTIVALWRLCEAAGVKTVTDDQVVGLQITDDLVEVSTASGRTVTGEQVIVTAGNWTNEMLALLDLEPLDFEMRQMQVSHFLPKSDVPHTLDEMPIFIDHVAVTYGLPQINMPGVKLGFHTVGEILDESDEVRPLDQEQLEASAAFMAKRFPHLDPTPTTTYTCRYTWTPNEDFILSRHPERPQVIIGTGFSGHGFKFTPVLGEILADLACDTPLPMDISRLQLA